MSIDPLVNVNTFAYTVGSFFVGPISIGIMRILIFYKEGQTDRKY